MREFNRPGNGNIWKNKYLISCPNRIFSSPNNKIRENFNTNRKVFLLFIKLFFQSFSKENYYYQSKGFSSGKNDKKNSRHINLNSCTIDYDNAVKCLHNELFSIKLMNDY